jgi:hypothetical protein
MLNDINQTEDNTSYDKSNSDSNNKISPMKNS